MLERAGERGLQSAKWQDQALGVTVHRLSPDNECEEAAAFTQPLLAPSCKHGRDRPLHLSRERGAAPALGLQRWRLQGERGLWPGHGSDHAPALLPREPTPGGAGQSNAPRRPRPRCLPRPEPRGESQRGVGTDKLVPRSSQHPRASQPVRLSVRGRLRRVQK